jgi:hypothetical protein
VIARHARVHEVISKRLADTSLAHFALVSLDEGERIALRLSADEHARLEAALVAKRRFVISLSVAMPESVALDGAA